MRTVVQIIQTAGRTPKGDSVPVSPREYRDVSEYFKKYSRNKLDSEALNAFGPYPELKVLGHVLEVLK